MASGISGISSFDVEKYSYSTQLVPVGSVPNGEVSWSHHPARDNLFLVFDTRQDVLVKVIYGKDIMQSVNINELLSVRVQPPDSPLIILVRSPSIAFKYTEPGTRKIRRFQVRIVGDTSFQGALNILRNAGCPIKNVSPAQPAASEAERPLSAATSVGHGLGEDARARNFRPFLGMSTANMEPAASFGYKPQQNIMQNRGLNYSTSAAYVPSGLHDSSLRPVSAPMFYTDDAARSHGQYHHHQQQQNHHHKQYSPPYQQQQYAQRPPSVDSGISSSSSQDYYGQRHHSPSSQTYGEHVYARPPSSQHYQHGELPPPPPSSHYHRRKLSRELSLQPLPSPILNVRSTMTIKEDTLVPHRNQVNPDTDMMAEDEGFGLGLASSRLYPLVEDNVEPPPKRKTIDFEAAKKVGGDKPLPSKAPRSTPKEKEEEVCAKTSKETAAKVTKVDDSTIVVAASAARKRKAPSKKAKEMPLDAMFKKAKTAAQGTAAKSDASTANTVSFIPSTTDENQIENSTPPGPTPIQAEVRPATKTGKAAKKLLTGQQQKAQGTAEPSVKFDDLSIFFQDPIDYYAMENKLIGLLHNDDFIKLMERLEPLSSRMTIKQTKNLFINKTST